MTTEEVIREFERDIRIETLMLQVTESMKSHDPDLPKYHIKRIAMAQAAIAALRAKQEADKNEPLTVEQVQALPERSWLWVQILEPSPFKRALLKTKSAYYRVQMDHTEGEALCCGYPGMGFEFEYKDYGKTWVAYRCQPGE